jgi:hypothetical protein
VTIEKPPAPISAAAAAQVSALLSEPSETLIRSWLPSTSVRHSKSPMPLSRHKDPTIHTQLCLLSWCWVNCPWCHPYIYTKDILRSSNPPRSLLPRCR